MSADSNCNIVVLLTDGFGGFGGIAKFNRDLLCALAACPGVDGVHAIPRLIPEKTQPVPSKILHDSAAAKGALHYVFRAICAIVRRQRIDIVLCAHLHLLPLAWVLARCR